MLVTLIDVHEDKIDSSSDGIDIDIICALIEKQRKKRLLTPHAGGVI